MLKDAFPKKMIIISLVATLMGLLPGIAKSLEPDELEALRQKYLDQKGLPKQDKRSSPLQDPTAVARQVELERQTRENLKEYSRIEADYNKRPNGAGLNQFGYETFVGAHPVGMGAGTIPEDYQLGVGDEIIINVSGQTPLVLDLTVDNEGRLVLPNLPPIQVAGRTFGEVREELEARVSAASVGSKAVASVGTIRMISVMVMGEVFQPGMVSLTGLSSLIDAIYASGGVTKMGSLRNIALQREGQPPTILDTYDLLMNRSTNPIPLLQDGDRVVVPTIGHTVAVTGEVKRPGIFELRHPDEGTTKNLLEWAGGPLRARGTKLQKQTLDKIGREIFKIIPQNATSHFGDSDILEVRMISNRPMDLVRLGGEVRLPGEHPLASAKSIRELIGRGSASQNVIGPRAYLPFAVLQNHDQLTGIPSYRSFNLQEIIRGGQDIPLRDKDHVLIFSDNDIRFLSSTALQKVLLTGVSAEIEKEEKTAEGVDISKMPKAGAKSHANPQEGEDISEMSKADAKSHADLQAGKAFDVWEPVDQPVKQSCNSLRELAGLIGISSERRFSKAVQSALAYDKVKTDTAVECPTIYEANSHLLPFVLEHISAITGEVRRPGNYPMIDRMSLETLVSLGGGFTNEHDPTQIEINRDATDAAGNSSSRLHVDLKKVSASDVPILQGDVVQISTMETHREKRGITLAGEFTRPGYFDIRRDETLSSVIERAGGLTEQAYPLGAVFSREQMKKEEKKQLARYVRDLQDAMLGIMQTGSRTQQRSEQGVVAAVSSLIDQTKETKPIGRIVIEADPTILSVHPELDTILMGGDTLYMPKRTNTMMVMGEVLSPGAFIFTPGLNVEDYIRKAGGLREFADQDRMFVVKPDGTAQPLRLSAWNFSATSIPPGSTIVIPREVKMPTDFLGLTQAVSSVVSGLAISAAAIASIQR